MEQLSYDYLDGLKGFLRKQIEGQSILEPLERMLKAKSSTAGSVRENVFTREFLCPAIAKFFYEECFASLNLPEKEIEKGLGAEGHRHCKGFGFTPNGTAHLFHKGDVIRPTPPKEWLVDGEQLTGKSPWPDFAIRFPLPLSVVGEVKLFAKKSPSSAIQELYDAARQAIFYLGAFRGHYHYEDALLVVADVTENRVFTEGLARVKLGLLDRFGQRTGIHLLTLSLS